MVEEQQKETDSENKLRQQYIKILSTAPKAITHLHLDGSLSIDFIKKKIKELNLKDLEQNFSQIQNVDEVHKYFNNMQINFATKNGAVKEKGNFRIFDFCNQFLQTKENLEEATYEICLRMALDHGVNCLEIRFAPVVHTIEKLTEDEAIESVIAGFSKAKEYLQKEKQIIFHGGLILCALRSYPVDHSLQTVQLVNKYIKIENSHIIGFDLAGDEGQFPLSIHQEAFVEAKKQNIPCTVHAGEWDENFHTINNVKLALQLNIDRIGHGLTLRTADYETIQQISSKGVPIEICMTSNCTSPLLCQWFDKHPLPILHQREIKISGLNPDNTLLAGNLKTGPSTPEIEMVRALLDCELTFKDLVQIVQSSYESSFDKSITKGWIQTQLKVWNEIVIPNLRKALSESFND